MQVAEVLPLRSLLVVVIFVASPLIVVKDLTHIYAEGSEREWKALKGINLEVNRGEFVAILGHNGSGKSTLAKHLNGLLLPSSGQVIVDGIDTADLTRTWEVRQKVGMVFQNPDNQLVATTVEEDVAFGPENLGIPSVEIQQRVAEALAEVGMSEYRLHSPHQLSGGQKQRVAIAGMIAMRPECIVLDEPTAMLDPVGRQEVLETVLTLNKKEGITIIYITHAMEEAIVADRIIVMEEGQIALTGTPRQVFSQVDLLYKLRLDVPQVTALAARLRNRGYDFMPSDVLSIEEMVGLLCQSE